MNGYKVTVKTPKKHAGKFYVKRGVVMAESKEEALALAKKQFGELPTDTWQIDPWEPKTLIMFC